MLEEKINETLKQALKNGEKVKVSVLRMLISEIKNRKIFDRSKDIDDAGVISIVQKQVKQHKESIEQFKKGNREDLVAQETEELAILEKYLPPAMSESEMNSIVEEIIKEIGADSVKDMGKVMKLVMLRTDGRIDGRLVSDAVRRKLT
ncbi:MAG: GatB/YqeY domain-containing protein [Candidatus Omnitrophota bacterium]